MARLEELYNATRSAKSLAGSSLPFDMFYEMISGVYDTEITDQQVATLYREAYISGGCSVNLDSILVTFTET